jgi:uncharacterized phage protein (TIGR01671 family)
MREIKFRVWDNLCKVMLTFEKGYLLQLQLDGKGQVSWKVIDRGLMCQALSSWDKDSDGNDANHVLMQYTGLKDKKGKEIYGEGDIYKDADGIVSVVKMAVDGWALFPIKKGTPVRNLYWHNVCDKTKGEIIGNIHQNPELLEKK